MTEPDLTRLHALVIGINKYKSPIHSNLDGCVPDATSIINYLTGDFRVPREQILELFDEKATRKGILDAFRKHLIQNEKIQPGDPILVYFSGHGGRQDAPKEWNSSDDKTELIFPHDASSWDDGPNPKPSASFVGEPNIHVRDGTSEPDHNDLKKVYVHGIPDRTLGAFIHQLSKAKGDNITVVLDSCHSGSATRGECRARSSNDPDAPPIPADIDMDFGQLPSQVPSFQNESMNADKQKFGKFVAPSDAPSLETHVLLAACKNDEVAQEIPMDTNPDIDEMTRPWRGLFTTALLAALRKCDLATTSYSALMRIVQKHVINLPMQLRQEVRVQMPQCEGRKQDRLLFRTQFALTKGMIQLDRDKRTPNTFRIKAGSASGIKKDTELGVYSGNMLDMSELIAFLVVTEVTDTEATLRRKEDNPNVEIPENAYVVVTKYSGHSVRILAHDQLKESSFWQDVFSLLQCESIDIVWSKPDEPSNLVLKPTEKGALLLLQDPSLIQLHPRDIVLDQTRSDEELTKVLSSVAHFHFHLQRRNPNSPLHDKVGMKLIELQPKLGRAWGTREYIPSKDNTKDLFGSSLSSGAVAHLKAARDKRYGLQLTNTSNWPLFAWVLYFDLEDYSITFLYSPPAQNTNPPLSTNGKMLAVGYGDAGVEPLRVENSGYSATESGVFMLFVSNTWVDIAHMEQASIFGKVTENGARNEKGEPVKPGTTVWDVFIVGVSIGGQ